MRRSVPNSVTPATPQPRPIMSNQDSQSGSRTTRSPGSRNRSSRVLAALDTSEREQFQASSIVAFLMAISHFSTCGNGPNSCHSRSCRAFLRPKRLSQQPQISFCALKTSPANIRSITRHLYQEGKFRVGLHYTSLNLYTSAEASSL